LVPGGGQEWGKRDKLEPKGRLNEGGLELGTRFRGGECEERANFELCPGLVKQIVTDGVG